LENTGDRLAIAK
jgi:Flp pilus assembly protein TadD